MATIKAYTDLEQSKKLAEILPIESADMYWKNGVSKKYIQCFTPFVDNDYGTDVDYDYDVPCWSLSALLGVLSNPSLHKTYIGWRCDSYNENCTKCQLGDTADNPIDACVEMVLKLHELNLL